MSVGKATATVGVVGTYGLMHESCYYYEVLESVFKGCGTAQCFVDRFDHLDALQQAGVYLYLGLEILSTLALVAIVTLVLRKTRTLLKCWVTSRHLLRNLAAALLVTGVILVGIGGYAIGRMTAGPVPIVTVDDSGLPKHGPDQARPPAKPKHSPAHRPRCKV
ncbi:MAG: hypothetical protein JO001_06645 [Alphaproteobacteria bacterium]|nr:hypothetical protein [Alphaproteobacteria bacterium]